MLYGIDFSYGSGLTTGQIKGGGKSFVCRYLSNPGNPKNISSAELANYKDANVAVVFNYEYSGTDAVSFANGVADAHTAQGELNALAHAIGDSSVCGATVFFSVDEQYASDVPGYFSGAGSVLGKSRVGVYGGIGTVSAAFNAGVVAYGWQTYAWSNGQWDDRALLRQVLNNVRYGPATVDLDQAEYAGTKILTPADDYGQWPRPVGPPPPVGNVKGLEMTANFTNATATWKATEGATHYGVALTTNRGATRVYYDKVYGTSIEFHALEPQTGYAVHVTARPDNANTPGSTAYAVTK